MPFCRTVHQNAFAKSSRVGTWWVGREGPKSLWSGVNEFNGERRILGDLGGSGAGGDDGDDGDDGNSSFEFALSNMNEEVTEAEESRRPRSPGCSSSIMAGIGPLRAICVTLNASHSLLNNSSINSSFFVIVIPFFPLHSPAPTPPPARLATSSATTVNMRSGSRSMGG